MALGKVVESVMIASRGYQLNWRTAVKINVAKSKLNGATKKERKKEKGQERKECFSKSNSNSFLHLLSLSPACVLVLLSSGSRT